jgi:hypothetical protein
MKKIQLNKVVGKAICAIFLLLASCGGGGGGTTDPVNSLSGIQGSVKPTLSWEAPTVNVDGTPLTDLAGFKIYYSTISPIDKAVSLSIDTGNATTYALEGFESGTYYFAVTAYDNSGNESDFSDEISQAL